MKLLWLTILGAIVIALATLYLASRPQLDRSLVDSAPASAGGVARIVPPSADDIRSGDKAAPRPTAAPEPATVNARDHGEPLPAPQTGVSQNPTAPRPVASQRVPTSPTLPPARADARTESGSVDSSSSRTAQPAATAVLGSPAPVLLPRAPRPSPPTGRLASVSVGTETPSAAAQQAAQCRALAAYLRDLQVRADRAGNASETAMVFEQRRITYARQGELGCES